MFFNKLKGIVNLVKLVKEGCISFDGMEDVYEPEIMNVYAERWFCT